jgi:hypothetical protein
VLVCILGFTLFKGVGVLKGSWGLGDGIGDSMVENSMGRIVEVEA